MPAIQATPERDRHVAPAEAVLSAADVRVLAGPTPLVRGVSAHIRAGERVALVGESGSGKSLFCRAITGLLPEALTATGSVTVLGEQVPISSRRAWAKHWGHTLGWVGQESRAALNPLVKVGAQIAEPLRNLGWPRARAQHRMVEVLESLEFADPAAIARRYPGQLSGGQRQRVAIAVAVAASPQLVIADEPTSSLDPVAQQSVLAALTSSAGDAALLLVTHDLAIAAAHCDRLLVMDHGRLVADGATHQVLADDTNPVVAELVQATRALVTHPTGGHSPAIASKTTPETADQENAPPPSKPASTTTVLASEVTSGAVLEAQNISKVFTSGFGPWQQKTIALQDVTFRIDSGAKHGIIGVSGSGKSTLMRILLGGIRCTAGEVFCQGTPVTPGRTMRWLRRRVQFVPQDPGGSLNPTMTIADCVAEPLRCLDIPGNHTARVDQVLELMSIPTSWRVRLSTELSGGQRQRVAIARALAIQPTVIIADEPTSALDSALRHKVLDTLAAACTETGCSIVLVTHDMAAARYVCDDLTVLHAGRVVETGPLADIIADPQAPATRRILTAEYHLPTPKHQCGSEK